MNCLEFRRLLLQDPHQNTPELFEHEANCADCERYSRKIRAQESALKALLNEVAPPPELAENIRLRVRLEQRASVGRKAWYALAASILLMVGVSMSLLFTRHYEREHMALAQNVIYHIEDEARHLRDPGPAAPQRVHAVLARFGAELEGSIGRITFAAECVMRHRTGVHMILVGANGPVTVFLMPGERAARVIPVDADRFHGEIVPTRWGALAVIGEQGERIEPIVKRVRQGIRWPEAGPGLAARSPLSPGLAPRVAQVQL
jgi:hypothetical protein